MHVFDKASFDLVIDKGTLDAMLCGKDGLKSARRLMGEVCRVLRPHGSFVLISHMEFTSEDMQGLLQDVIMPTLDGDRSVQWRLAVHQTDSNDTAAVFVFSSQPKRFTRHMLTQPTTLPTTISTFDVSR